MTYDTNTHSYWTGTVNLSILNKKMNAWSIILVMKPLKLLYDPIILVSNKRSASFNKTRWTVVLRTHRFVKYFSNLFSNTEENELLFGKTNIKHIIRLQNVFQIFEHRKFFNKFRCNCCIKQLNISALVLLSKQILSWIFRLIFDVNEELS